MHAIVLGTTRRNAAVYYLTSWDGSWGAGGQARRCLATLALVAGLVAGCRAGGRRALDPAAPPGLGPFQDGASSLPAVSPPLTPSPEGGAGLVPAACVATDPETLAGCVDVERIAADLNYVGQMRPPGSAHWLRVQRRCAEVFEQSGFDVTLHEFVDRSRLGPGGVGRRGVNVLGVRAGWAQPEARVVVGAHYDHIAGCEGADDNASGVAAVLELARVLGPAPTEHTVVVACWDQEEAGLLGSRAWVAGPMRDAPLPQIYVNLDGVGFTDPRPQRQRLPPGFGLLFPIATARLHARELRADFVAAVGDTRAEPWVLAFARHGASLGLPVAQLIIPDWVLASHIVVDLQRSDHAPFWNASVPAMFLSDTANFRSDAYHCRGRPDTVDTLDLPFVTRVVRATVFSVAAPRQPAATGHSSTTPNAPR